MIEIDLQAVISWGWLHKVNEAPVVPQNVRVDCPNYACGLSFVNLPLTWNKNHNTFVWTFLKCSACQEVFHLFLLNPPTNSSKEAIEQARLYMHPSPSLSVPLQEGIERISPSFVEIYRQATMAEQLNLNELNGIGYRKAIEFLVKDYLCAKHEEQADEIKGKPLGACINDYFEDSRIQACAKRAVWLGNDETHYYRQWEDKGIDDLKTLIKLTLHWLSMELLTEKYETDMPEKTK